MKLPSFAYHPARSVEEAVELLNTIPGDARVLAGGQSLIPLMTLRLAEPSVLVDITTCQDLSIYSLGDASLVISAAVTSRTIETAADITARHPLLVSVLRRIGHPEIRNRGTVCGSVAHADPAAELPALLLALGGSVRVIGTSQRRQIPADEFFVGPFMTSLEAGELVESVEIPVPGPTVGWSFQELTRRSGDFAIAGTMCLVDMDPDTEVCRRASITLFGVSATPTRCWTAEQVVTGKQWSEELIEDAALTALREVGILGDIHGSEAFRRRAATALVRRGLSEASDAAVRRVRILQERENN